jgi:hypothetical protein
VSFFELPELDPPRPWRPRPPWYGAPEHELGVSVPARKTIAHTDEVWLGIIGITAYSVGFTFRVRFVLRNVDLNEVFQHPMSVHRDGRITDRFLRLGVEFADGLRATNLEQFVTDERKEDTDPDIVLDTRGSSGRSIHAWIWPLPPPGQLSLLVEWPSAGVELTRVELPGDEILEAAALSTPLWEDDPHWAEVADDC